MQYLDNVSSDKEIKGLILNIDPQIQSLCEVSNNSSSHTRSTLYILVLTSIISLITILNTSIITNWTRQRISFAEEQYRNHSKNNKLDSIEKLKFKSILIKEVQNKSDRIELVQIPIIGNVFDINNLALVSGLSFVILLYIVRYMLRREKKILELHYML